jgi:6-phosphogluconate dehydrogenase (decarboxylating)
MLARIADRVAEPLIAPMMLCSRLEARGNADYAGRVLSAMRSASGGMKKKGVT